MNENAKNVAAVERERERERESYTLLNRKEKNKIKERDICINASNFGVQLKKENNITIFEKYRSDVVGVGVPDDPQ